MEEDKEEGERGGRRRLTSEEAKVSWRETLQLRLALRDDNDEEEEGEDEEERDEEQGASEVESSDGGSMLCCFVIQCNVVFCDSLQIEGEYNPSEMERH